MTHIIKRLVNAGLEKLGYKIQKYNRVNDFTMDAALERCIYRGLKVATVIDIGSSDGRWSKMCMNYFTNANYLLIEAQEGHKSALDNFKALHNNVNYILAAAGNKEGEIFFNNDDLFAGVASETPFESNCIVVPAITVDNEIRKFNLNPPYLLKLDTHGFEIPILEGASDTLKNSELVIIEAYNFQLTRSSLKFYQLCDYMEKLGFYPVDIADLMLRIYDRSFWQMDIFFLPSSRKEFTYCSYK